jgi:hypothetical protein
LKQHQKDTQKRFIHTHQKKYIIGARFRDSNFNIKGGIVHSVLPLSFHYCYVAKICIDFFVKMKGNINKEMVRIMKRKESLDLESRSNQLALEIKQEEKKIKRWW